ncbi:hypothetical protein [aff. Roholtiella sp. LEGE 12411]|uniref:hypothetical protein n=1 Tax=aff. Roholtiella sp. LEGE 12411 TaxID=1828822 RepID=UPI00187E3CA5|nr:hypothetical protein [aff. Roholtiella sp. LEGE 12411]MBE9038703.1 hypothetical protein [aff. Roholtiella sp. LEGE 12411]
MSKLATFRVEDEQWEMFQQEAKKRGVSASSLLQDFVAWVNQGNDLPLRAIASPLLEKDIDQRIETKLAPVLEEIAKLQASLGELAA